MPISVEAVCTEVVMSVLLSDSLSDFVCDIPSISGMAEARDFKFGMRTEGYGSLDNPSPSSHLKAYVTMDCEHRWRHTHRRLIH